VTCIFFYFDSNIWPTKYWVSENMALSDVLTLDYAWFCVAAIQLSPPVIT